MFNIPNYEIISEIHSGTKFSVYKGKKQPEGTPVIIKTFSKPDPTPHDIVRFRQESEFSNLINYEGVIKTLALEHYNNKHYLIMESIEGDSLKKYLAENELTLKVFLSIALSLARTIGQIHSKNIIHKDIKPSNIIINPESLTVKITDFGIATILARESASYSTANSLEGTLAYISPEQTGRMNRSMDYRSDLYSLGVSFYEMLAGRLPFEAGDAISVVHSHIAVTPERIETFNRNIPPVLAQIIHKLMEKNAEDRYQSAQGLEQDLDECLRMQKELGSIDSFEIAKRDFSGVFQILQKLYGRSNEISLLMDAYNRVAQGATELLLVGGYSGVGKTALVNETHKPITAKNGLFIGGKFDQYQRDVPYFAVTQAFNTLCDYWMRETDDVLNSWKQRILKALGNEAQVLVDIIPHLEMIIGKQTPVPELLASEAQQRLSRKMEDFLDVVCQKEHPLCIFIDDLQWADSGSLSLLSHMVSNPNSRYMFLICAYRDNEVNDHHPFIVTVEDVKKQQTPVISVILKPLTQEDVGHLISDSLHTDMNSVEKLSSLTYEKTNGNAFFVNQFLKALYGEDLLEYDFNEHAWKWDIDKIKERNVTDNVVELMTDKVSQLDEKTTRVLQLASCIGNKFELNILAVISEKSPLNTMRDLWGAVDQGLIIPMDNNYKLLGSLLESSPETAGQGANTSNISTEFQFIHDRVQQGAYLSIPEGHTAGIHLNIGRLIHRHGDAQEQEEQIFKILNQYEKSIELITDSVEKETVAELCLRAANRAMKSSAFIPALNFAELAIAHLLTENSWEKQYELTLGLFRARATCQYSAVRLEESELTCREALKHCTGEDEIVDFYKILSRLLFGLNRHYEGLDNSRECLKILGVTLPKNINKINIAIQYVILRLRLGFRSVESLVNLKEMNNQRQMNILRMLYDSVESSYMVAPDTMGYNSVLMANITLKHGTSIYSGFGLAMTSLVQCGVTMELELGDRFCRTAENLNQKYPDIDARGRVNFLHGNFTRHWTHPVEEYEAQVNLALQCFKDVGSLHWGTYSQFFCRTQSIFFNSNTLKDVIENNEKTYHLFHGYKDQEVALQQNHILNFLYWLRGKEQTFRNETYPFEPEAYEKEMSRPGNFLIRSYYHTLNMIQDFMQDDYEKAFQHGKRAFAIVIELLGNLLAIQVHMFYNLCALQLKPKMSFWERTKIWLPFKINKARLWYHARKFPRTFSPYFLLHKAEEARVAKRYTRAEKFYHLAVKKAGELDYAHISALCHELAGKYYLERDRELVAGAHLQEAHFLYYTWGATTKVKQLESKYSRILRLKRRSHHSSSSSTTSSAKQAMATVTDVSLASSATTGGSMLDLQTIVKVTQAISGEIKLENLLRKLMHNVIENAGAQSGVLILSHENQLLIQAHCESENEEQMQVLQREEIDTSGKVPVSIINFVARTRQEMVIDNAQKQNQFENDAYIKRNKPISILCLPILNQGHLIGMLYLENNVIKAAFNEQRLRVLSMLAAQAAISLDNALLYNHMESKVEEQTREVRDIMVNVRQGIFTINKELFLTGGYSGQVTHIFETVEFAGPHPLKITDLVNHQSLETYLDMLFTSPFVSENMLKKSNPISNLDYVFINNQGTETNKKLSFTFFRIFKTDQDGDETREVEKIMVVVDDNTEEYALKEMLEQKASEHESKVERLYSILSLEPSVFSNFISESTDMLEQVHFALSALGNTPDENQELLQRAFREVHTLKGNARALNLESIGKTAHALEDIFAELTERPTTIEEQLKEKVLESLSKLKDEIADGNSLFEKILNMQQSLSSSPRDPMTGFAEEFRNITKREAELSNKQIQFNFKNEFNGTLKPELLQKLHNPLSHIVRNSCCHGIESPEVRSRLQKSETGQLTLTLKNQNEDLLVIIEDDGVGLNTAKIRQRAADLNLFPAEQLAAMDEKQIHELIFSSGLSTQDDITDSSGRGVGMDAARATLKSINANISLNTKQNQGTRFKICIPLGMSAAEQDGEGGGTIFNATVQ